VIDATGSYTYADLAARSARVAAALLAGRPDLALARIPFLVEPGFDYVATALGIWRAGGIAVPLATSHPPPELEYVLDDADPDSVVVDRRHTARLAPLAAARNLGVVHTDRLPAAEPAEFPATDPARPALMIYTSGTTGRPKGVITTYGNIEAQIGAMTGAWGWSAADRIVHALPLHHVHGVVNALLSALAAGATVIFAAFEPTAIWNRFAEGDVTLFMGVPTMYHRLIAEWDRADESTRARWSAGARGLRLMVSGSAPLPVATLARWRELTGHTLLERYGMTEIGMALSNPLRGERRPGTVGQPFPGVELRLVDEQGEPVPAGTPGQVVVRGPQVFREYWRRPDATRAAFRDGWFLTGDVAVLESGYYRLLGRESVDLIKSAGYKISALEIEEVLRQHPAVSDCAVIGVADPDLGERIAAVVTLGSGPPPDPDGLRAWAKERLAPYKVPRLIRFVDALPRNAMGKVTKPALRALFG
jgi:malonyl-CoA/methylmalonyl-CoA synthetase